MSTGVKEKKLSHEVPQGLKPTDVGPEKFYRIEVRPKSQFVSFRTQELGKRGNLERIAGKRRNGSWDTVTWLVAKEDAHMSGENLIIDNLSIASVLTYIEGPIVHKQADVFKALPRS